MKLKVAEAEMRRIDDLVAMFHANAYILQPVFDAVHECTKAHSSDLAYDILGISLRLKEMTLDNFRNQERVFYRIGVRELGTDSQSMLDLHDDKEIYVGGVFVLTGFWDEPSDTFTFRLYAIEEGLTKC